MSVGREADKRKHLLTKTYGKQVLWLMSRRLICHLNISSQPLGVQVTIAEALLVVPDALFLTLSVEVA